MHRRRAIREAIVSLVTGLPITGANVTQGRVYPLGVGEVPALDVTTTDETLAFEMGGGPPYSHTRDLTVEVTARAEGDNYIVQLDDIALEVETAMMADPYLSGLVANLRLLETSLARDNEVGETPIGELTMSWGLQYNVASIDPQ